MVLIGLVGLCLLVATGDALLTKHGMQRWFPMLHHPPGTPPRWAFPLLSALLAVAGAVAAWRVWCWNPLARLPTTYVGHVPDGGPTGPRLRRRGLLLWSWQLAVSGLWTPLLFALHRPFAALELIVGLSLLVLLTLRDFLRIDRAAGLLMAPSLAWMCYAAWLNAGIAWLNPA